MKNLIVLSAILIIALVGIGAKTEKANPTQFAITAKTATEAANQINSWAKRGFYAKLMTTQLVHLNRTDCELCGSSSEREYLIVLEK